MIESLGAPRYRAKCTECTLLGRPLSRLSVAEGVAATHAREAGHIVYVIDHYGIRIAGTTVGPGTDRSTAP